jgi:hypothetical protein
VGNDSLECPTSRSRSKKFKTWSTSHCREALHLESSVVSRHTQHIMQITASCDAIVTVIASRMRHRCITGQGTRVIIEHLAVRFAHLHLVVAVEPWLHTTWPHNCCSLRMPHKDLLHLHRARQAAGNHHRLASKVLVAVAGFVSIHRHHTSHLLGCLFLVSGSLSPFNIVSIVRYSFRYPLCAGDLPLHRPCP